MEADGQLAGEKARVSPGPGAELEVITGQMMVRAPELVTVGFLPFPGPAWPPGL